MKHCWFICNKLSLTDLDLFIDGDLILLKWVFLYLFSFMWKFSMNKKLDISLTGSDINGLGVEPIDNEKE